MAGIYIHIPFCRQACHYCDFHFSTNLDRKAHMVQMICKELNLRKAYLSDLSIETVYFGGGTPSLLEAQELEQILDTISDTFGSAWEEVTLEANPDDLSKENLHSWKSLGIDRLSLGIQSFEEKVLKFYNRAHSAEESRLAIENARKVGFEKFSLDLIYGFPHADHALWKRDLTMAINQNPGHISSYALTVEPKTALGNWTEKGKFIPADEDFVAEQFELLQEMTASAGYIQYEVSNFGKPGEFALHNMNYWKAVPFLGVGPSAHSFDGKDRGANPSNNALYLKSLEKEQVPFEKEQLSAEENLNEYILTGLRTIWGIDLDEIKEKYQVDLAQDKERILAQMQEEGWLIWKENHLSLSKSGKLLADSISSALFI
ncbi:radical SAM family heme chaperone HemW [Algoriphagus halophytocola]|uniref:Heme chaperone HemW n=1 Tax=Algoriphagus halophytocola TaxID=2991499 RepID=A0ABY6MG34_9BACT|nr:MULTISPECIES: radical SAM family heme chaperone HemW [unclassified Algoriphagus]UZD21925.1 radical SAM family heme chaperone HemW [Algoriphagus sp. TR-M5]WBL43176.1 radical SAM family heme chaperone HemW [Algoriphagus sp. TR-M9]